MHVSDVLAPSRSQTAAFHRQAVDRVIRSMREHLSEDLSLGDMSDVALISPFHFNRVFRRLAGIPPCQYLGVLRLDAAKRLLLTTRLSVTDICSEVGYNSLGTFMRRFKEAVGVSPRQFRRRAQAVRPVEREIFEELVAATGAAAEGSSLQGRVEAPEGFAGPVFIGLFPTSVPQGHPLACALRAGPGPFQIDGVPDGRFFVFGAGYRWTSDPGRLLLADGMLRSSRHSRPVVVRGGRASARIEVALRPPDPLDPPMLVTLPLLLEERVGQRRSLLRGRA